MFDRDHKISPLVPVALVAAFGGMIGGHYIGSDLGYKRIAKDRGISVSEARYIIDLDGSEKCFSPGHMQEKICRRVITLTHAEKKLYQKYSGRGLGLGLAAGPGLVGLLLGGRALWRRHRRQREEWENFPAAHIHNPEEYVTEVNSDVKT